MTRREDRMTLMAGIGEASAAGARLAPACSLAGIDLRTFQRWRTGEGGVTADRRPETVRPRPTHALGEAERARIVAVANEPRFASTPPARIVPALADEGVYLASEASFHRVLRDHGQMRHRGRARPPRTAGPPSTHVAASPGQVWCWDVTFLPSQVRGRWFYLYLILDLFSRKIVGFEVHDTDQAEHAAHLVRRTALAEGIHARLIKPVLHGDNGPSVKGTTVLTIRTQSVGRSWRAAAAWWRVQGDGMTDLQAAVADDDALDQQLQDRLPFGKACLIEPGTDAVAERRQVGADCLRLQPLLA